MGMKIREVITQPRRNNFTIIVSHEDLDGVSSAFLAKKYAEATSDSNIIVATSMAPISDVTYSLVKMVIDLPDFYEFNLAHNIDRIIVCDRSLSLEDYKKIKNLCNFKQFEIFDHHIAQQEEYANIKAFDKRVEVHFDSTICATLIIANEIANKTKDSSYIETATVVDCWDTFKWKNILTNASEHSREEIDRAELAVKLNKVACTIGPRLLYDTIVDMDSLDIRHMEGFELLHRLYDDKLDEAYESLNPYNTMMENRSVVIGGKRRDFNLFVVKRNPLITGDKYSLIADRLLDDNPYIDIVMFVSDGLASFRGRSGRSITPLEFAKLISPKAGGHAYACGLVLLDSWAISNLMVDMFLGRRTLVESTVDTISKSYKESIDEFYNKIIDIVNE